MGDTKWEYLREEVPQVSRMPQSFFVAILGGRGLCACKEALMITQSGAHLLPHLAACRLEQGRYDLQGLQEAVQRCCRMW